jgi:hypothetical protein
MKWQDDVHDSTPGRDKVSSAVSSFEQNQFCESLPPLPHTLLPIVLSRVLRPGYNLALDFLSARRQSCEILLFQNLEKRTYLFWTDLCQVGLTNPQHIEMHNSSCLFV